MHMYDRKGRGGHVSQSGNVCVYTYRGYPSDRKLNRIRKIRMSSTVCPVGAVVTRSTHSNLIQTLVTKRKNLTNMAKLY